MEEGIMWGNFPWRKLPIIMGEEDFHDEGAAFSSII